MSDIPEKNIIYIHSHRLDSLWHTARRILWGLYSAITLSDVKLTIPSIHDHFFNNIRDVIESYYIPLKVLKC